MNSKLILTLDGEIINEHPLEAETLSIGRKHDNDIQLNDLTVSGRHAMISCMNPEQTFVEDLGSNNGTLVNGNHIKKTTLKHGDIINVLDRSQQKVFVMGEVTRPSAVEIVNSDLSLSAALGEAGGVRQTSSDPSRIFVIRGSKGDDPKIYHLDAKEAYGMILAERFQMQAQDILFVDTAGISRWNRVISQLLPTISVLGVIDNVAQ